MEPGTRQATADDRHGFWLEKFYSPLCEYHLFSYYLVLHQKDAVFILSVIQHDYDATECCVRCIYINDMLRTNGHREAPMEEGETKQET